MRHTSACHPSADQCNFADMWRTEGQPPKLVQGAMSGQDSAKSGSVGPQIQFVFGVCRNKRLPTRPRLMPQSPDPEVASRGCCVDGRRI